MVSLSLLLPLLALRQVGSLRWEDTVWDQRAGKPYRIMEPVVRALLLPLLASRQVVVPGSATSGAVGGNQPNKG